MYLLKAVRPIVAGVTYVTNASTKPSISHNGTPKSHFPSISTADAKGISNVAHNRSLTAKAMMYILMVDLSFGFLYTAKQTRAFPKKLMMFKRRQTLASIITMISHGLAIPARTSPLAVCGIDLYQVMFGAEGLLISEKNSLPVFFFKLIYNVDII